MNPGMDRHASPARIHNTPSLSQPCIKHTHSSQSDSVYSIEIIRVTTSCKCLVSVHSDFCKMSTLAAGRVVHGLGAIRPLDLHRWNKAVGQRASRVSLRTMAVANPDVKSKSSQDQSGGKKPQNGNAAGSVAMETVAKKAPVTYEYNVSHKDLPIENARKLHTHHP